MRSTAPVRATADTRALEADHDDSQKTAIVSDFLCPEESKKPRQVQGFLLGSKKERATPEGAVTP
jgi:hypothetical protein